MKDAAAMVTGLALLMSLTGCDNYVDKGKYEASQRELQQVRTELNETKKQLQDAQRQVNETSAQKFSTYQNGGRTWRFNSTTGETCILLTSDLDWKNKKTKSQSCACQDSWSDYLGATKETRGFFQESMKEACEIGRAHV